MKELIMHLMALIISILSVSLAPLVLCQTGTSLPKKRITVRCLFNGGNAETSIEDHEKGPLHFKELLLKRFNLPAAIDFAYETTKDGIIEVNAQKYTYQQYQSFYNCQRLGCYKSWKSQSEKN